jgi:anthranilate phosphoribosyltransferase
MYKELMRKLTVRQELSEDEIQGIVSSIKDGVLSDIQIAGFLAAFLAKGYSPIEIANIAKVTRSYCIPLHPKVNEDMMDTCGTGGGLSTFNISTATAILAASAGILVAKHGCRSITSLSGSADVVEALGVEIQLQPREVEKMIEEIGIAFLYAPNYHPVIAKVIPAEIDLGIKLFNTFIGPLINPTFARRHLLGVCNEEMMSIVTLAAKELGFKNLMCVHGLDGLDEISLLGKTRISHLTDGDVKTYEIKPEDFGLARCTLDAIRSGTPKENAETIVSVLAGKNKGAARDAIILNTAGALIIGSKAAGFAEGVALASELIDSGAALAKLMELRDMSLSFRRAA